MKANACACNSAYINRDFKFQEFPDRNLDA